MHKFTFLDNTANFVLNPSFCGNTSSVTMAVKHPILTIVCTWKNDKLQNQHEFLMVVITTEHVALPDIQLFL